VLQRYDIDILPADEIELFEAIARQRGCIVSGGRVDMEKVSRLLINELRSGDLGGVCFETPAEFAAELEQAAALRAQKAADKAARKQRRNQ